MTTGAGDDGFYLAVGRIVHFNDNDSTCQAAIVTLVRPGDFEPVDLTVFPNGGGASHQGNVIHVDQPRSWHWPRLCQTYRHKTGRSSPVQPAQKDAACPYGITDCGCTKPHSNTQWCHGCRHWCVGEYCARICPHPPGTTSPAKAESGKDSKTQPSERRCPDCGGPESPLPDDLRRISCIEESPTVYTDEMISQRRAEILATSFAIAGMGTPGRTSAGGVSMSGRILTREEYADAIDMVHATEKRELLERFDVGAERYGILDLSLKDWEREEHEERLDKKAYKIFDWVRKARGL